VESLCAPGGVHEITADTWDCAGRQITFRCFKTADNTLREMYEKSFPEFADNEFIVYQKERYTYRQIYDHVCKLSRCLVEEFGVKKGDRIAVAMRNYPEWISSFVAISGMGCTVVPLNGWWKTHELEYGLTDSKTKVLICDDVRLNRVAPLLGKLNIPAIVTRGPTSTPFRRYEDIIGRQEDSKGWFYFPHGKNDDFALMYTSGTTGFPKGVVCTHRGVCNSLEMTRLAVSVIDKFMAKPEGQVCTILPVPLFHVTATHHNVLPRFIDGGRIILMRKWDPLEGLKLIQRERPQRWTGVPTMVQDMMEHPDFKKYDTTSLTLIGGGGTDTDFTGDENNGSLWRASDATSGLRPHRDQRRCGFQ